MHLRLLESVVLRDGVQVSGLLASLPGDVYAHISLIISYLDPLQALLFAWGQVPKWGRNIKVQPLLSCLKSLNLVHSPHHVTPHRGPQGPSAPLLHQDIGGLPEGLALGLQTVLSEIGPVLIPPLVLTPLPPVTPASLSLLCIFWGPAMGTPGTNAGKTRRGLVWSLPPAEGCQVKYRTPSKFEF